MRTHQVRRNGATQVRILSPLGHEVRREIRNFAPATVIAFLDEHAIDRLPDDVFALEYKGQFMDIAWINESGQVRPIAERSQGVRVMPLPPISKEDLKEKARAAIQKKADKPRTNLPISAEFKSFLARVKYMIYMDAPSGSAPLIRLDTLSWKVVFVSPATSDRYEVERMGGGELEILCFKENGTVTQDMTTCPAVSDDFLAIVKEKGWR